MIDASLIPSATMMDMAEILYQEAKKAFRNPDFQKAYEQWAEERRANDAERN